MHELLVPVGNKECLRVAIHSGADAVYLAGKRFGARAFAGNFTDEELIDAIKLCHLYGVKIYVTVNTLIYESELASVFEYVKFLHKNGVDAVIMQDIGLIYKVRRELPNLEIHASTQMHVTNENCIKLLEELGVKRIVLARELSLKEINDIHTPLEKEVFIHGALCVCYSGQCLFSSIIMNRSGNRGECAQMCRLPFNITVNGNKIYKNDRYLLSPKELNTSSRFKELLASDITSFKIEGRMKSPEYVGCVTRLYRDLIDKYERGEEVQVDSELLDDLKVIFNREFTTGFLFESSSREFINTARSNHVGILLGTVKSVNKSRIYISLERDLNQGDGIRFNSSNEGMIVNFLYDEKGKLINKALKGSVVAIDKKVSVKVGESINKTSDSIFHQKYVEIPEKKIPIKLTFKARLKERISLGISDGINHQVIYGVYPEEALNAPISIDTVKRQLTKLGNTPFSINDNDIFIDIDEHIFINIKALNELRRQATDALSEIRKNKKCEFISSNNITQSSLMYDHQKNISVLCRSDEQVQAALACRVSRIYIAEKSVFDKYSHLENVYWCTSRTKSEEYKNMNLLISELGSLYINRNQIGNYYLNVCNHEAVNCLMHYAKLLTLSVELSKDEIRKIMEWFNYKLNIELLVYSRIELMITKYDPLNNQQSPKNSSYYLVDRNKKEFPIISDRDGVTHILGYETRSLFDDVDDYLDMGITDFRIELFDEDYQTSLELIHKFSEKILKKW